MGKLRPHSHITFSYPSSTLIQQYFDFTEILPKDSYIQGWWDAYNDLNGNNGVRAGIYFRDVDFFKDATRQAMYSYVNELVEMPYCGRYPTFNFWLVDFDEFVKKGYEGGEIAYLDLLTAQTTYSQTNLAYIEAVGELWAAIVEIEGLLLKDSLGPN